ncbi:MAG TPA: inositol monophosphatase family protein [Pyrinomonadaceae bacterium]|nr:inositol monophosphatase family protein [Pyrinomonadaceae bacterium]
MLNFAIQTAREAGRVLAGRFGRQIEISNKSEIDLVTESDLAAERLIIDRISTHYPRHTILAEESGTTEPGDDAQRGWRWIIDPLDGTTNYAHGYPCFCVSIALECRGRMEIAVVYDPIRDEMFTAERGGGAALNGRRISVSLTPSLASALLCTGFPYDVRERHEFARHFAGFIMTAQGVRRDGAAALDLAYVAAGRFDGFWEEGLKPWDVAAGVLLIDEAGGRVTNYANGPFDIFTPPILASNGLIHEEMMRVLNA